MNEADLRWKIKDYNPPDDTEYILEIQDGTLVASFGVSEEPKTHYYRLDLLNKNTDKEIAYAIIYIGHPDEDIIEGLKGDLEKLLGYSSKIFGVPGIPKERLGGFKNLVSILEEKML